MALVALDLLVQAGLAGREAAGSAAEAAVPACALRCRRGDEVERCTSSAAAAAGSRVALRLRGAGEWRPATTRAGAAEVAAAARQTAVWPDGGATSATWCFVSPRAVGGWCRRVGLVGGVLSK